MKPQVSIIMPYYKDVDTVKQTIDSIYDTIGITNFELIVVNDGPRNESLPKDYKRPNMKHIQHWVNIGVGQAFDTGVGVARSDNLILIGSDIVFLDNNWCKRMLNVNAKHQSAIICAACGSTKSDNVYYGADIVFYIENKDLSDNHPRKGNKNYRSILEGKWRGRTGRGVYQVPSVMGAFYGVKKAWYNYICGFELHYKWGVLEPLISLKSWKLGGEVLVDTENKALHIFDRIDPSKVGNEKRRESRWDAVKYNQLMIAGTVFSGYGSRYAKHLEEEMRLNREGGRKCPSWDAACESYMDKVDSVNWFNRYFQKEAKMTPAELEKKMVELSVIYNGKECKYKNPLS